VGRRPLRQHCCSRRLPRSDMPQKNPGLLGRGRGGLTTPDDRQKALEILEEGIAAGGRASERRR